MGTAVTASRKRLLDAQGKLNYRAVIQPTLQYELYNPAYKEIEFNVFGITYRIPGCDDFWQGVNPGTGETITYEKRGVLPLFSVIGRDYTAADIVKHVLGSDGRSGRILGPNGVRMLFGDDEELNELSREEANQAWLNRAMMVSTQTIKEYEATVRDNTQNGRRNGPMPNHVREAYEARRAWTESPMAQFMCSICEWPQETPEAVHAHVLTYHKDHKAEVEAAQVALGAHGGETGVRREASEVKPIPHIPSLHDAVKNDPHEREEGDRSHLNPNSQAGQAEEEIRRRASEAAKRAAPTGKR